MIEAKIIKKYGDRTVLDIDASFEPAKIYAVIGKNGSGKSTFLNALCAQIRFDGYVKGIRDFVYMPQTVYNFDFSVKRNITLFLPLKDKSQSIVAKRMAKEIGLDPLLKKNARLLSGGEAQKTALLRTLLRPADILLLDEPTSSMDSASTLIAEQMITDYHRQGMRTVFFVTHSVSQAERIANEILFFDNGKIVECGPGITKDPQTEQLRAYLNER